MIRTGMGSADTATDDYQTSMLQKILANQGSDIPPAPAPPNAGAMFLNKYSLWIELGLGLMYMLPKLKRAMGRRW